MTDRLFTPPGEQVTTSEAATRRAANQNAQEALPLDDDAATAPYCPGCGSTRESHVCTVEALALEVEG